MKTVFFGGGSHRLIPILLGALARRGVFDEGHIHLYDLNVERAEAIGRIVAQSPQAQRAGCRITWGNDLDACLEGADAVAVVLMAGTLLNFNLGYPLAEKWGFIASDNVSPNGALLGVKGAPILLDLARRMEKKCPEAILLNFANPVAVLSGMVNRHTKIEALGVCAGFTNHLWDIGRIFGCDEMRGDLDVETAGVNHLSFIVKGTLGGKELFSELDAHLAKPWKQPRLSTRWSAATRGSIRQSVSKLIQFYRQLGVMVFSTESDGLSHLEYEAMVERSAIERGGRRTSRAQIEAQLRRAQAGRGAANERVASLAGSTLDADFWKKQVPGSLCAPAEDDVFLRALVGISGVQKVKIATSRLNEKAITNLPEGVACEYTQTLHRRTIKPFARHAVPDIAHGLISALATHQTMLGDACAAGDPKLLAHALLAYPMRPFSKAARGLFKDLIALNRAEIAPALRTADQYL